MSPCLHLEALFEETLDPTERTWLLLRFLDQTNNLQAAMEGLERVGADACPVEYEGLQEKCCKDVFHRAGGSARKKGLRRTRGRGRRIRERRSKGAEGLG